MITEHTNLTCPDCRGALERIHDGSLVQYRCRVGHTYSPYSAVAAHALTEENMLWASIVTLEEGADLSEEVAKLLESDAAERLNSEARLKRRLAERVREILKELRPTEGS